MADLGAALVQRLVAAPGVTDIASTRGFWVKVPPGAVLPYYRMQVVSDDRDEDLEGYTGVRDTRVQIDCFGSTHAQSQALAEAIVAATAEPDAVAGVLFGRIKAEGPRDLGEDVPGKGFIHRASLDLLVSYRLI